MSWRDSTMKKRVEYVDHSMPVQAAKPAMVRHRSLFQSLPKLESVGDEMIGSGGEFINV